MYICSECKSLFEEPKVLFNGLGLEAHLANSECVCPYCNGVPVEAVQCPVCGEWVAEDDLENGVCPDCKKELRSQYDYDYSMCYKLAEEAEPETVSINSFLASMLSEEDINNILLQHLAEADKIQQIDCSDFARENMDLIVEAAEKEVI